MNRIFICALLCLSALWARNIDEIRYQGLSAISNVLADEIVNIKPGDSLDIAKVDKAVVALYSQGFFEDIYASYEGGVLTFHLTQKPKVASVEIKGYGSEQEKETLYSQIGIKKGDSYDETKLARAKIIIRTILEYQGYYGTVVESEIAKVGDDSAYAITFSVNQGENIVIKNAIYDGREKLKVKELEELSANRQKQFMGWLWGRNNGKLKLADLEYDHARIQDVYMRKGFLDASVSQAFLDANFNDYSANLYYKINEGERYKVTGVRIVLQVPVIEEEELRKILKVKKDTYFNIEEVREDVEKLRQKIANLGYAFARVSPDLDKDSENAEVKVLYLIQVGQKVKINDVLISGNTRTADRIIRRELLLAPGDTYNFTELKESENTLRRLGYFGKVQINERRVSEDSMDLLVNVEETRTGELMFGLGYGSYDKLMINASIRERNLFGTGQSGQLYADWSYRRQLVNLTLSNPRVLDSKYSTSFSVFHSLYWNWDYREQTTGGTITAGKLLTHTLRASLGYTLSTTRVVDFYDTSLEQIYKTYLTIDRPLKSAISPSLYFDNTDDYYFPKNGAIISAYVEYAGLGGDEKYTKFYGKMALYYHLKSLMGIDLIARYKTQAGAMLNHGYVPITSKFYMGGISSVRGYQISSLTPRDPSGRIRVGGNYMMTHSAELSYGILEKAQMRLALFVDYGMIGVDSLSETTRASWGAAIEWISPMGPIVLVFPQPINPQPGDRTSRFEFTMGTRF
ncbi:MULTISPECIES: outer membrane protein assembly factor BamA [Helicobacter]|uniref:Outer membrane protein assembly factor BamA n=5 Tax=Helicobacter typhlonius TaxID=76936 RepID=A0A099UE37_9HELI|nr:MULTISPECIES: outer membrane protein assembly factor BamA [Helicobacter]TLD78125.1 outer membrane protein assembly factor BamA [Helicobacter typhlonius]TLD86425.1 outer membrane protein assembly factor BamA [Helicobacter sp. MIT 03-1616]CUU39081.1 Outer membrane protein assembly factor YaeT precursor [Helicobacter typhlonius]